MPVDACSSHTCLYREAHLEKTLRPVRRRRKTAFRETSSYLKLSQNNAIVCSGGFKYTDRRLAAEGVAESGDVLCLCQSEQQTVSTVTCQPFTPWTTNGTFSH